MLIIPKIINKSYDQNAHYYKTWKVRLLHWQSQLTYVDAALVFVAVFNAMVLWRVANTCRVTSWLEMVIMAASL